MQDSERFSGAKLALLIDGKILAYKRDAKPDLQFAGYWDLPGGGREGNETPQACALRELDEEFSLRLDPTRIEWIRSYPSTTPGRGQAWFMAGQITQEEISRIQFGDEGQYWRLMTIEAFLEHPMAVPHLQVRLRDYLAESAK